MRRAELWRYRHGTALENSCRVHLPTNHVFPIEDAKDLVFDQNGTQDQGILERRDSGTEAGDDGDGSLKCQG
jgi:hypothetical protein